MKKKILILDADYDNNRDNTAYMVARGIKKSEVEITRVCENKFPANLNYEGFIINGSAASFDDDKEWIRRLIETISKIHEKEYPLLGICFGHQLIAHSLEGKVEHGKVAEKGYKKIYLTGAGVKDALFHGKDEEFVSYEYHKDLVTKIPPRAVSLAKNDFGIQSFRLGNTRGVQFHPDITPALTIRIAKKNNEDINKARLDAKKYGQAIEIITNFERYIVN